MATAFPAGIVRWSKRVLSGIQTRSRVGRDAVPGADGCIVEQVNGWYAS